jgi:hypothetical protein
MADGSVTLSAQFLGLPALTYLQDSEAVGSPVGWNRVAGNELAGMWVLTLVFVVVVIAQAVRVAGVVGRRDLTLRQVRWVPMEHFRPALKATVHVDTLAAAARPILTNDTVGQARLTGPSCLPRVIAEVGQARQPAGRRVGGMPAGGRLRV